MSHELNPSEVLSSFVIRASTFPVGRWDLALRCAMETGVEAAVLSRNRLDFAREDNAPLQMPNRCSLPR